jgi:hypothetical protein
MAPFEPVGQRARWKIVYGLLTAAETGTVVTYEEIGAALGLDPGKDRHTIQMAVRRAARQHEVADKRALDVVPNSGYMVVHAQEHLRLARKHQSKGSRSLARGQSKVVNVDLSELDPETRRAFEVVAVAFKAQVEFIRRLDVRQARLEDAVNSMTQRTERTELEIDDLKARLARLEEAG